MDYSLVEEFIKNGSNVVFCCRNSTEGKTFVWIRINESRVGRKDECLEYW